MIPFKPLQEQVELFLEFYSISPKFHLVCYPQFSFNLYKLWNQKVKENNRKLLNTHFNPI